MAKTKTELENLANQISTETNEGANSAARIGGLIKDVVEFASGAFVGLEKPLNPLSDGFVGEIRVSGSDMYIYTQDSIWRKVSLSNWAAEYKKVVFLGASIIEQSFGRNLTSKNEARTAEFLANGNNVDVYGYGFSGYTTAGLQPELLNALAAHPTETLFIVHIGGNDVTNYRPYSSSTTNELNLFNRDFDNIIAAVESSGRKSDVIFVPISFRSYADPETSSEIYDDESLGSLPFNENIFYPKMLNYRASDFNTDGNHILDFYNYTRNNYKSILGADGIHPTNPAGRNLIANFFNDRINYFLKGGSVPAPIVRDVDNILAANPIHYFKPDGFVGGVNNGAAITSWDDSVGGLSAVSTGDINLNIVDGVNQAKFNGGFMTLPDVESLNFKAGTNPFSFVWKTGSIQETNGYFFSKNNGSINQYGVYYQPTGTSISAALGVSQGQTNGGFTRDTATDLLYILTVSTTGYSLYVNGVKKVLSNVTPLGDLVAEGQKMLIGGRTAGAYLFDGTLERLAIYNKELSLDEVSLISNQYKG
ncbi:SGNH hydrolase [Cellulophaga phage phi46:1]|uniref:tail fiber protein n=1 Tax=Cellulophaga phage phi46:1 TaxID=1327974 RepID=UPI000351888A|nr:tail fiber protein [Cellulophaga phage phi46:1]AGO47817.1 SGNH hydrolase [Cellulophaga phage phi46:1]